MIVPGALHEVEIPDLRALGGLTGLPASEVLFWVILSAEGPEFAIDGFDYRAFDASRWKTYSIAPYIFITH
jgi:hypothetical protein